MTQDVEEQDESKEDEDKIPAKSTSEANKDGKEEEDNKDYHRNVRHRPRLNFGLLRLPAVHLVCKQNSNVHEDKLFSFIKVSISIFPHVGSLTAALLGNSITNLKHKFDRKKCIKDHLQVHCKARHS